VTAADDPHGTRAAWDLVARAVAGDSSAWDQMYRDWTPAVLAALRRRGLASHDAEDLTAVAWLRALEHFPNLQHTGHPRGWLVTVATNAARDRFKSSWFRQVSPRGLAAEWETDEGQARTYVRPDPLTVEDEVMRRADQAALLHALCTLPSRHREVLVARTFRGMSCSAVAAATGSTVRAVEGLSATARQQLRPLLEASR
jgi:RNA polymerase sigma-70 factor (ECF subfamily)